MSMQTNNIQLVDLINIQELQQIQDSFALSFNIASVISIPDGTEITKSSNYNKICQLIHSTDIGSKNCMQSNLLLGKKAAKSMKPEIMRCTSCGFLEGNAPIIVDGKHIASWHISHKTSGIRSEDLIGYAEKIGLPRDSLLMAYEAQEDTNPINFKEVVNILWLIANQISNRSFALYKAESAFNEQQILHTELEQQKKQLQKLTSQYLLTEEKAKRKIALELHDSIGHSLVLLKRNFHNYTKILPGGNTLDQDFILIEDIISQTRNLTFHLSNPLLYDFGLSAALESLADDIFKPVGIEFKITDNCPNLQIKEDYRLILYRMTSELFYNILKHSRATLVRVNFKLRDNTLISEIIDDGVGFYYNKKYPHEYVGLGLFGIEEHLSNYGGSLKIDSKIGSGTNIEISLPIHT